MASRVLLFALTCLFFTSVSLASVQGFHGKGSHDDRRILHGGSHEGEDEPASLQSGALLSSKGAAMAVFFIVPFLGVWIPFILNINGELLKYGILFGAGLFVTLAFEHIIADSSEVIGELTSDPFPFAYLYVVLGYMATWLTDIVIHAVWDRRAEQFQLDEHPLSCCKIEPDVETMGKERCSGESCNCDGLKCKCGSGMAFEEHLEVLRVGVAVNASLTGKKETYKTLGVKELGVVDIILLVVALMFHAVFEGLAAGLAGSTYSVWQTTISIVLHKIFEGVALGSALKSQDENRTLLSVLPYAFIVSIMAPIGIAIGIILDRTVPSRTHLWVEGVGDAIAAGVFIFVSTAHLIVKGMKKGPGERWWTPFVKWVACGLGVMTMSLIQLKQ